MQAVHALWPIVVIIALLLCAWWAVERFSPDPLITKICQVIIFLIALYVVIIKLLPMVL